MAAGKRPLRPRAVRKPHFIRVHYEIVQHKRDRESGPVYIEALLPNNQLAGFICVKPFGRNYRLCGVAITIPQLFRLGIGTKLYERAHSFACARGKLLRSDDHRSPFSESFWRKQKARGRARCLNAKETAKARPSEITKAVAKLCYEARDHPERYRHCKKVMRRKLVRDLPVPMKTPKGPRWPCREYVMRPKSCSTRELR